MKYRSIQDKTWVDPWHLGLSRGAKLVFHYLIEHACDNAGVAEQSPSQIEFHTGVGLEELESVMVELDPKVVWFRETNHFFVVNLYRYQASKTNIENFRKSAKNQLASAPQAVRDRVGQSYPELVGEPPPPTPPKVSSVVTPTKLIEGLLDKLRASHPAWEKLGYPAVQQQLVIHGREVVTYALQSLVESGTVPTGHSPYPLFVATCDRLAKETVSA